MGATENNAMATHAANGVRPLSKLSTGLQPARDIPAGMVYDTELKFIPDRHLAIQPPATVKTLDFSSVDFPYRPQTSSNFPGLAYTEPFRLLSDEGTAVLRGIVDQHQGLARQNERNNCLRGLGYMSQWVRDMSFCPEVVSLLSALAKEELWPHDVLMHLGHTNFGAIGSDKAVDEWHTDSTDYVFVLILSDTTDMEGGELKVLQMGDSSGLHFDRLKVQGIPADKVETVKYPGAGYCIFMQGTRILHSVTPVVSAREPRISFVNSYGRRDVFAEDRTRFSAMKMTGDNEEVSALEYARHKAWRVSGQMSHLIDDVPFGATKADIVRVLENSAKELIEAKKLLLGEDDDHVGFFVQRGKGDGDIEVGLDRNSFAYAPTKVKAKL